MSEDEATMGGTEGASLGGALRPRRVRRKPPAGTGKHESCGSYSV